MYVSFEKLNSTLSQYRDCFVVELTYMYRTDMYVGIFEEWVWNNADICAVVKNVNLHQTKKLCLNSKNNNQVVFAVMHGKNG